MHGLSTRKPAFASIDNRQVKHLLAITITLLPSAVLAQQFTPQQMLDVMTKSPSNRNVRVHDSRKERFSDVGEMELALYKLSHRIGFLTLRERLRAELA